MAKLAINGGPKVRRKKFPAWPICDRNEIQAVTRVLKSGRWWYGEKVAEFEQAFAAFQTAKYGVSCSSGTTALMLGLLGAGVGAGDEVIVPPYTFIATASAVLAVNAIPIFADIDPDTCNLDLRDVEAKITPQTKAVIPVHFAGLAVDMDGLLEIAQRCRLKIIEDACHSWGASWKGKGLGTIGDGGAFSFQLSKNITAGEGGIFLSDQEELAEAARSFSNFGRRQGQGFYQHFMLGHNFRMTEIQAAILLEQLKRLEDQTVRREASAAILNRMLGEIPGISLLKRDARVTRHSYHIYIFKFRPEQWCGVTRERFLEAVNAEGIPVKPGYPVPLYKNPLFQRPAVDGPGGCPLSCPYYGKKVDYTTVICPNAEAVCAEACWIHQQVLLAEPEAIADIGRAIAKLWENRQELK